MTDNTEKKLRNLKPWQPGTSGNPQGRPKGVRNKFTEDYLQAFYDDFKVHGREVFERVRKKKPEYYLQAASRLIPRDFKLESNVNLTKIAHVIVDVLDKEDKAIDMLEQANEDEDQATGTHETESV